MALIIQTQDPQNLLNSLNNLIRKKSIKTWILDAEGDLTNANPKWTYRAWFKPYVQTENNRLAFGIIPSTHFLLTNEIYAVYHGRLASTLLAHFDFMMNGLSISPGIDPNFDKC